MPFEKEEGSVVANVDVRPIVDMVGETQDFRVETLGTPEVEGLKTTGFVDQEPTVRADIFDQSILDGLLRKQADERAGTVGGMIRTALKIAAGSVYGVFVGMATWGLYTSAGLGVAGLFLGAAILIPAITIGILFLIRGALRRAATK